MSEQRTRDIAKKIKELPNDKREYLMGYMEGVSQAIQKNMAKESKGE